MEDRYNVLRMVNTKSPTDNEANQHKKRSRKGSWGSQWSFRLSFYSCGFGLKGLKGLKMIYTELYELYNQGQEIHCQQYRNRYCEWRQSGDLQIKATYWQGGGEESDYPTLQIVGNLKTYEPEGV